MKLRRLHSWDLPIARARELQVELASQVDVTMSLGDWSTLAAADVSFLRGATVLHAAVIVYDRVSGQVIEKVGLSQKASFPYVPGLLSFREAPAILDAFERIENQPDIVLVDGQGIAHPRGLGIASHLGLFLGLPTIGCAKSRLCGEYDEPKLSRGSTTLLMHKGMCIGEVVRTRSRVKPLFVSPGHLCDQASATKLVLELASRFRLPTPTRLAHDYVNEVRRAATQP